MIRRAAEPDTAAADLVQARRQFGMTTWESPLAFSFAPRQPPEAPATPQPVGPSRTALIARERPPATTHVSGGALTERVEPRGHDAPADHG